MGFPEQVYFVKRVHGVETHSSSSYEKFRDTEFSKEDHADSLLEPERFQHLISLKFNIA